jgi:hypothetical protein
LDVLSPCETVGVGFSLPPDCSCSPMGFHPKQIVYPVYPPSCSINNAPDRHKAGSVPGNISITRPGCCQRRFQTDPLGADHKTGAFFLSETVTLTADVDHMAVVEQPVRDGCGNDDVAQPRPEADADLPRPLFHRHPCSGYRSNPCLSALPCRFQLRVHFDA